MTSAVGIGRRLMLDPEDPEQLAAHTTEQIAESAAAWLRFGGHVRANKLYRVVLERDPHHAAALRAIARATSTEDVDRASALFRRADQVDGLEVDDYVAWCHMLLLATPPRQGQAAAAARRLRDRFPEQPKARAHAALVLAGAGDIPAAAGTLAALNDTTDLSQTVTRDLVELVRMFFDPDGPWVGSYSLKRPLVERLLSEADGLTLLEGANLAFIHFDFDYAKDLVERITDRNSAGDVRISDAALKLRAMMAEVNEQPNEVIRLLDCLRESQEDLDIRLIYGSALHGVGRIGDAEKCCLNILARTREPADDQRVETVGFEVRALLLLAAIRNDKGDFCGHWGAIQQVARIDPSGLAPGVQAAIILCRCAIGGGNDRNVRRLADLRDSPGLSAADMVSLERAHVESLRLRSEYSESLRSTFEITAREALSRTWQRDLSPAGQDAATVAKPLGQRDHGRGSDAKLAQAAYLALLAGDSDVARTLIGVVNPSHDSWRESVMRAVLYLRESRPVLAIELLEKVIETHHHDLDLRCLLVQAELAAERINAALRDVEAILRFAPDHMVARLLQAEAFNHVAALSAQDGANDYHQLIRITAEYGQVLRLHKGLRAFLAHQPSDLPVGSEPLSGTTLVHVARQCALSAVRATRALARAGLRPDPNVLKLGKEALLLLKPHDRHEAKRMRGMLDRAGRTWLRRRVVRGSQFAVAGILFWLTLRTGWPMSGFQDSSVPRIAAGLGAVVALLWPYISKFSVGGLQVERAAASPVNSEFLPVGAVNTLQVGRMLAPTPPREVQFRPSPPVQPKSDADKAREVRDPSPEGSGGSSTRRDGRELLSFEPTTYEVSDEA